MCPKCLSHDIGWLQGIRPLYNCQPPEIGTEYFSIPRLMIPYNSYTCFACGHKWEEPSKEDQYESTPMPR